MAASAQEEACVVLVARALDGMAERCADLPRDHACYGYAPVFASFAADSDPDFSGAGDRAPLSQLLSLKTAGLSAAGEEWGVAVLRLAAHRPATRAGSGVVLLLVGEAELIHDVDLTRLAVIGLPLQTATLMPTTLYAQQSKIAEETEQLDAEAIVLVDAISGDGEWLRVVNDGGVAWAESANLARLSAMDALPVIDTGDPFAFRYFTFSSTAELPACADAESMLVIQTPAHDGANLRINGADIHISSLVSIQQLHSSALSMTVHRGAVSNTAGETITAGHSVVGVLDGAGRIMAWSGALPASELELARGERAQVALNGLARSNGWEEFETEMAAGAVIHTVALGDTLYALARLYDVPVADIIAANTQAEALRLLVGEELIIPNPGSGFSAATTSAVRAAPVISQPKAPDCSGLRLTSPQRTVTGGASPFYWDGIPAATGYRVDVWDHGSGTHLATLHTDAGQTTVTISAGELRVGGALQWEVTALVDGQPICNTGRSDPLAHVSS